MSLDAGRAMMAPVVPAMENVSVGAQVFDAWKHWEPSHVTHHGRVCCEIAREWILNTDLSSLNGANKLTGPRWLRHRFEWGPGTYPLHWCEIPKKTVLDCGILAALSYEIFIHRGVRCFRAQLVQEFADSASAHWRSAWEGDSAHTTWINDRLIYHEGCAVLTKPNEIKLWDSSAGWWVDPKSTSGYGSVLAVKIAFNGEGSLRWGKHMLQPGVWNRVTDSLD